MKTAKQMLDGKMKTKMKHAPTGKLRNEMDDKMGKMKRLRRLERKMKDKDL